MFVSVASAGARRKREKGVLLLLRGAGGEKKREKRSPYSSGGGWEKALRAIIYSLPEKKRSGGLNPNHLFFSAGGEH